VTVTIEPTRATPPAPLRGDELVDRELALERGRWVPGEPGIWALILTDLGIFSVYFITIMYEWRRHPAMFAAGHRSLSLTAGILNTFFLLTASCLVALGVQQLRQGRVELTRRLFAGSAVCGTAFVVNKIFEWSDKVGHGRTPTTNTFYQLYFMITGIHLAHVLIAMTLLGFMRRRAKQVVGKPTLKQARFIENCATYWHMVDLLWLVILALFFLMG
jgi:nitric oxide reductase NorE protein